MSIWEGARVLDQGLVDGQSRHLRRCEPAVLTSSECFEARFWKARKVRQGRRLRNGCLLCRPMASIVARLMCGMYNGLPRLAHVRGPMEFKGCRTIRSMQYASDWNRQVV